MKYTFKATAIVATAIFFSSCGNSEKKEATVKVEETVVENEVKQNPLNDVYWGDTHLHTDLSLDAGAFGNRIGMDEAYRFAKGEEVTSSTGLKAKLSRPLDFLVIADHSDGLGLFPGLISRNPIYHETPEGRDGKK